MLNDRLNAARGVADALRPAEQRLDDAILETARLTIAVVEGRRRARLPFGAGQEGLDLAMAAANKLVEARRDLGAAHLAFRRTKDEIGLRAVAVGDLWDCPPDSSLRDDHAEAANVA